MENEWMEQKQRNNEKKFLLKQEELSSRKQEMEIQRIYANALS
jgi:hypothetical protein